METPSSRLNLSNIIAACIIAVGLVASARINSLRPNSSLSPASIVTVQSARPLEAPPVTQEAVQEQVRTQVLKAADLQTYEYNGGVYKLSDAIVFQVVYSTKDDTFEIGLDLAWEPEMPSDGPRRTYLALKNNGYNEYIGMVSVGNWEQTKTASIRVK